MGFRLFLKGLGRTAQGGEFGVQGGESTVWGLGFGVQGFGLRVQGRAVGGVGSKKGESDKMIPAISSIKGWIKGSAAVDEEGGIMCSMALGDTNVSPYHLVTPILEIQGYLAHKTTPPPRNPRWEVQTPTNSARGNVCRNSGPHLPMPDVIRVLQT